MRVTYRFSIVQESVPLINSTLFYSQLYLFVHSLAKERRSGQQDGRKKTGWTCQGLTFWVITDHQQPIPTHDLPGGGI